MSQLPKILSTEDLSTSDARWVSLKKINWQDQEGKKRVWEAADRRTRGGSGIDAVAILALIRSKTRAFPISTVIIEQYRPPIGKFIVELPAGLIDDGETPEKAAIRELQEETGYEADRVLNSSAILASDPGMSTANMKLVVLDVPLDGDMVSPNQNLQDGEAIVRRTIEVKNLYHELKEYEKKDYVIDARLLHLAAGFDLAERLRTGDIAS
ncbi:NUDIX hydrolase domain-like protein [Multifurca ochricompacta]|uniref:NUDIX hydrolase domain-like protein n=1 Tax=Multifurca ochricompacta TaxID=376703 RepID=A0AAD4M936_9AGAM|nr:NUDIX hydrolase domain-like protein [Multifurca ochricompacta]